MNTFLNNVKYSVTKVGSFPVISTVPPSESYLKNLMESQANEASLGLLPLSTNQEPT
jgi:hypothetical protein